MRIIGHRGAAGLAPENTVASLLKAVELGVDEIECDVRVTQDGIPILHHDPVLELNGTSLRVSKHSYHGLVNAKPDLPRLSDALRAVDRRVPVQMEIKSDEPVAPVIAVIKTLLADGWAVDDLLCSSYDFKILQALHRELPELTLVVIEQWSGLRGGFRARRLGTRRISMSYRGLWGGYIKAAAHGGTQLSVYTLNDPHKARRWAKYGLYGVITDYPNKYGAKQ